MLFIAWILITLWQFLLAHYSEVDYFGLSAVYLMVNFMILCLAFSMNIESRTGLGIILNNFVKKQGN
jgi:hypothetical protein